MFCNIFETNEVKGPKYFIHTQTGIKPRLLSRTTSEISESDTSGISDVFKQIKDTSHEDIKNFLLFTFAMDDCDKHSCKTYKMYEIDDYCVIETFVKYCSEDFETFLNIYQPKYMMINITHNCRQSTLAFEFYTDKYFENDMFCTILNNVQSRSFNMKFNETKVFKGITENDLKGMTLNIKLLDWNRIQANNLIGEINCSLSTLLDCELIDDCKRVAHFHKSLTLPTYSDKHLGSILIVLYLDMSLQQLKVTVVKAKDLKAMDLNNLSDPFCTLKLYCSKQKISSRKTSIKYKTLNPIWNESFPFTVTQKDFTENLHLIIKVYDKDPMSNDLIGEVVFPSTPSSIEHKHWTSMINNQRVTLAEWHSIKPSH